MSVFCDTSRFSEEFMVLADSLFDFDVESIPQRYFASAVNGNDNQTNH